MNWLQHNYQRIVQATTSPLTSGPALALSRRIFGNNAGLQQNVYGGLELWNARRNGPYSDTEGRDPTAMAVETVGYAKAPWRFSSELVDRLSTRFENTIANGQCVEQRNNRGDLVNLALSDPLRRIPEIRMMLTDSVRNVVHSYFGSNVRLYKPDYWRNFYVSQEDLSDRERFSERWHNDSGKVSILSLLVLMSDVDESHGATWCVTRDATRMVFRKKLEYREHNGAVSNLLERDAKTVRFTGRRGDSWFLNTRLALHRAGIPGVGQQRDILGLKFTPIADDHDVWDETPQPEEKTLRWQKF